MTRQRLSNGIIGSLAAGALVVGGLTATAFASATQLRLQAFAVDMNSPRARTATLDFAIDRWSTDADMQKLKDALAEKGHDALLDTLQHLPRAGYVRTSRSLGWDVHFAREVVGSDGSRKIIIATDRPMSFWEIANHPRSADYAFMVAEIRLSPDGKGEGTLVPAARLNFDGESNTFEVENFQTSPVRLNEVRAEK
jgi:hypothetical protein